MHRDRRAYHSTDQQRRELAPPNETIDLDQAHALRSDAAEHHQGDGGDRLEYVQENGAGGGRECEAGESAHQAAEKDGRREHCKFDRRLHSRPPGTEESLPWMRAGSPTCRPPGHYGAKWNACMRLAAAASCREASVTVAPLRTKACAPRSANVRDDMSPKGPPARIADFQRNRTGFGECCLSHANLGLPRHVAGSLAAGRMKGL